MKSVNLANDVLNETCKVGHEQEAVIKYKMCTDDAPCYICDDSMHTA